MLRCAVPGCGGDAETVVHGTLLCALCIEYSYEIPERLLLDPMVEILSRIAMPEDWKPEDEDFHRVGVAGKNKGVARALREWADSIDSKYARLQASIDRASTRCSEDHQASWAMGCGMSKAQCSGMFIRSDGSIRVCQCPVCMEGHARLMAIIDRPLRPPPYIDTIPAEYGGSDPT